MARRPSVVSLASSSDKISQHVRSPSSIAPRRASGAFPGTVSRSVSSISTRLSGSLNLHEIDPDELFTKHSISEVKQVQHRLRSDADAKQEELRLMVGERYRDLLQASTSIISIAQSSKRVLEALGEMRDTVGSAGSSRTPKRALAGEEDKHLQALQSLSAHLKLLLDAPEHLWRLMERKMYLHSAWLFLLARVVHRALSRDDEDQSWHTYGIDEQLPLVQRQWDTVAQFRSQIVHKATLSLREPSSSPGEACATLLTLHLLESRPLSETLSVFLSQRSKTLSTLLSHQHATVTNGHSPEASKANGKASHRARKTIVREIRQKLEGVVDLVSHTLGTARTIFAEDTPDEPSMMKQALQYIQTTSAPPRPLPAELQLTTQTLLTTLPSSSHFLLLPPSITAYKPYIDSASLSTFIPQQQLHEKLASWFRKAIGDIRIAMADWFSGLESTREVWDVHTFFLNRIGIAEDITTQEKESIKSAIDSACQHQSLVVWKSQLALAEASFREEIHSSVSILRNPAQSSIFDTHPVEYLFRPPPIPSASQSGLHPSTAAASFQKYKSALRQQVVGRTPLLDSVLRAFDRHAQILKRDLESVQGHNPGSQ
nr:hypothesis protein 8 [Mycoleptodonoides aitchisonii]